MLHERFRPEILQSFEIWCWRRTEKFSWADNVKNEEVLHSQDGKEYSTYNKKKEG
jgi:hypothetical protein